MEHVMLVIQTGGTAVDPCASVQHDCLRLTHEVQLLMRPRVLPRACTGRNMQCVSW